MKAFIIGWVGGVAAMTICIVFFSPECQAAGFQNVQADNYDAYRNCCNQQRNDRRQERRAERQELNTQQPIVGGQQQNSIWDTNPKQINGGQGDDKKAP